MAFDNDYKPNLITDNIVESDGVILLTISERVTLFVQTLFTNYIMPNFVLICIVIGIIIFLGYRYNNKKNRNKNIN